VAVQSTVMQARRRSAALGMQAAMSDPSIMEASKHAMGMTQKYGNKAEMLIGDEA
jgi:hypothetical protein